LGRCLFSLEMVLQRHLAEPIRIRTRGPSGRGQVEFPTLFLLPHSRFHSPIQQHNPSSAAAGLGARMSKGAMPCPLPDEALEEVLYCLPPHEPVDLVRPVLVSRRWRRLVSNRGFGLRFREFHSRPRCWGCSAVTTPTTRPPKLLSPIRCCDIPDVY
jgi:hypothetical protein